MGEIGHGMVGMSVPWATNMWAMLKDGGVWTVPRTGQNYRKEEEAKRLVLVARIPWDEGCPISRERLLQLQDEDHEGITQVFAAIGVEVTDETHSRKVEGTEGAGS